MRLVRAGAERGAAAVEFAIVLTVLIPLLLGIMEFGYAFFVQGTMAGAAREAARDYAIHRDQGQATAKAVEAGATAGVAASMVTFSGSCPATPPATGPMPSVTVTVKREKFQLTGFFGSYNLTAKGTMRCGA